MIGLKNFRIFKDYQEFKLKPITVLTGPNNSGKSTFSKMFKLINEGFRTRNNIKEIDVLYFTDKLRQEIGDFDANVSRFSDDDYIELSFTNRNRSWSGTPEIESTIYLKYQKVTAITFESRVMKRDSTTIQDKNIEAYLQSIRIVINKHEIIKLTRNEDDNLGNADFLDAYETNSITDELVWECDLNKKYASELRNAAVELKNHEISEIPRILNDSKYNQSIREAFVANLRFHKHFSGNKEILFPSLLSGVVLDLPHFFNSENLTEDFFITIRENLKTNQIISIEDFISAYIDLEEKFMYEVYILFYGKLFTEWEQFDNFKWMQIDSLAKILGKKINNTKLDETAILKKIDNPLVELLLEEFAIIDTPKYEHLLKEVPNTIKISFIQPTIEVINACIKTPYIETIRHLKEQEVEHYGQNSFLQNYYLKNDNTIANSIVYRFAEYFTNGLISKESIAFLNNWLKKLGVGDELIIKKINAGNEVVGYSLHLKKDGEEYPILENGLGIQKIIKILIQLSIHKVTNYYGNKELYGNLRSASTSYVTILLEEPESNLHPAFQSLLAEILVDAAKIFELIIIIETHSEYLIRKLQYLTAQNIIKPEYSVIYYFHTLDKIPEGEKQIKEIRIEKDGSLSEDFGKGFFDEATSIKFDLLRLKSNKNK